MEAAIWTIGISIAISGAMCWVKLAELLKAVESRGDQTSTLMDILRELKSIGSGIDEINRNNLESQLKDCESSLLKIEGAVQQIASDLQEFHMDWQVRFQPNGE